MTRMGGEVITLLSFRSCVDVIKTEKPQNNFKPLSRHRSPKDRWPKFRSSLKRSERGSREALNAPERIISSMKAFISENEIVNKYLFFKTFCGLAFKYQSILSLVIFKTH